MEKEIHALTVGTVDTLWYISAALVLSSSTVSGVLNKYSATIEKAIGGFLLFIAARLIYSIILKFLGLRLLLTRWCLTTRYKVLRN